VGSLSVFEKLRDGRVADSEFGGFEPSSRNLKFFFSKKSRNYFLGLDFFMNPKMFFLF